MFLVVACICFGKKTGRESWKTKLSLGPGLCGGAAGVKETGEGKVELGVDVEPKSRGR